MVSWLMRKLPGAEPVMALAPLLDMVRMPPPVRVTLGGPIVKVVALPEEFIENVPALLMVEAVTVRLPPLSILTRLPAPLVRVPPMVLTPSPATTPTVPEPAALTGALMVALPSWRSRARGWWTSPPLMVAWVMLTMPVLFRMTPEVLL